MSTAHVSNSPFAHVLSLTSDMFTPARGKRVAPAKPARRQPSQARSEQTVRVIFEAVAQVLNEQGEAALTTNRIAERAGVSIGTLYQYFDSKEAIVMAMLARKRERVMRQLDDLLSEVNPHATQPREVLRQCVRLYVHAFGQGGRGERPLIRMAWRLDLHEALQASMREAAERISSHLQRIAHPQLRPPTPAMVYVMTRLLAGTVRFAALESASLLGTVALEDELVNACWGVMAVGD
jgi:AcrR family transcriptional regulator